MKLFCAAAALAAATLSPAAPLQAQVPTAYEAAVAARTAGRPQEARRLLLAWLADHPDDVDARLQLAYADLALGRLDDAEAGFRAVLAAAPTYQDAAEGLSQVAARRSAGPEAGRGSVTLEGALSDLTGGAASWREGTLRIEAPVGAATTLGGDISYFRRFGREDVEITGRAAWRASDTLWLRAHLGGTPGADFRPELSIGGGLDANLSAQGATVLTFDARYDRFPAQDIVTLNPGLVHYVADGTAWVTLRGIGTVAEGGDLEVGALLRGDLVPAERWRVFAGVANGPDTDLGVVTRVTSLFGGVEAPLGRRLAVTGSIGHDWREGTGADRTEFRLGVKAGF